MALCLIQGEEDLVVVLQEECIKCTDAKLGVLQRWPLPQDPDERRQYLKTVKEKTLGIRLVRSSCECGKKEQAKKVRKEETM